MEHTVTNSTEVAAVAHALVRAVFALLRTPFSEFRAFTRV